MFQQALIESVPRRIRFGPTLSLSILAHGAAVAAAVWMSAHAVGEVGDPPLPVVLEISRFAAPLDSGGPPQATRRPPSRAKPALGSPPAAPSDRLLEPLPVVAVPTDSTADPSVARPLDLNGSSGNGSRSAVDESVGLSGSTRHGGFDGLIPNDAPIVMTSDVDPPELIARVEPTYPEAARKVRAAGTVVLEAIISAAGQVENVRVLHGVSPFLDSAAVAAIQSWRYRPARLNGRAVRVFLTVTVQFTLG